jgi:ferritin-like metal-binding protein YciE
MNLDTFENLFIAELRDLYSAESQLLVALPEMIEAAHHENLKKAFQHHLQETQEHFRRLRDIFADLGVDSGNETCEAMQGLIAEAEEVVAAYGDRDVKDVALIACAQRIEHYEIAGYGATRTFARHLGYDEHAELLDRTLSEEGAADHKLTSLAEGGWFRSGINKEAAHHR